MRRRLFPEPNLFNALLRSLLLAAAFLLHTPSLHAADEIPYQQFVLANGLRLIVHEDHKAPLVAVDLWYHVGSKNEKPGQTGFAHLFEHLMFNGSQNFNDEYFRPFEKAGATDQNGTTSNDRTNYFATVPTPALDMALWMESDRMANLLPALDQAKLDEQRGVVKNEKRQGDDRPFGKVWAFIAAHTFPAGHPYAWEPIGSMADLDAATLDDVHAWFKQYYGPNNAVLVIAGDIDTAAVKKQVEHYFGSIPPGPAPQQIESWIAKRSEEKRATLQDRVPNARVYLIWNTPPARDTVSNQLDLLADLLAGDADGFLTQKLVQQKKLATNVSALNYGREIAGQFWITADAAPGVDPLLLEQQLRAALREFLQRDPHAADLARAKINYRANFLRQLEKVGGFSGKADVLASGAVFANDASYYQRALRDVETTSGTQLRDVARQWLDSGVYVLQVTPQAELKANGEVVDRSQVPAPGAAPAPNLPPVQRAQLDNGMQLILLRRPELPLVEMEWQLPIGRNVDGWQHAGLSDFALRMLLESNAELDSAAIAAKIHSLGAEIDTFTRIDSAGVRLSALKDHLDASTALFARLIRQPDFADVAIKRLQAQTLATIKREEQSGNGLAQRVLPRLLLGTTDADSGPLSSNGRRSVIAALDREQLQNFHQRWFNPQRATLIAVGDLTMEQFKILAEQYFSERHFAEQHATDAHQARGEKTTRWPTATTALPPAHSVTAVDMSAVAAKPTLYFIDLPGSSQANISAATVLPAANTIDMTALSLANNIFGGGFTSRLNLNLREDKHWSYGTYSSLLESRGTQFWIAAGNVQIDKTGAALAEMRNEWQQFAGATSSAKPVTSDEFEKVREQRIRQLPGAYETNKALLQAFSKNVQLQRPDNYLADESARLRALDLTLLQRQVAALSPSHAVWLAVGDKQKMLPQLMSSQLQQLGWGDIVELDVEGVPLKQGH
ncbi:MAG TPA: pitrilysin family protein [Spongiibacteraceae bacterium]|nr:pitrilysin family protein [Spongiibacteraceae bacterium]